MPLAIGHEARSGPTRKAVLKGLIEYNRAAAGKTSSRSKRVTVSLREDGVIAGGAVGYVWMGVLFLELFWIAERHRRAGYGSRLIGAFEQAGREAGARRAYLDTFSFQAPEFYRKLGYRDVGQIDGYDHGATRHWLTKAL